MEDDPIKKLLQQTGWSYTEILKKLESYKDQFPTDSKSSTDSEEPKKKSDLENSNSSTNKNVNSIDIKQEDVEFENHISGTDVKTDEEESTNSEKNKQGNAELNTNEIHNAETRSYIDNCKKLDDNKEEQNNKNQESRTGEEKSKNVTYNKMENIELKENATKNSDSENNGKDELENSIENSESEEGKDEELENIIQRLEKFIEENAESDNDESYAEIYAKKSEYENNEKVRLKNLVSETKLGDVIKTAEKIAGQNTELKDSKEKRLESVAEHNLESQDHAEEKPEKNEEKTSKSTEKKDVTETSKEVMEQNREPDGHAEEKQEHEIENHLEYKDNNTTNERMSQNTESKNYRLEKSCNVVKCNVDSETHKETKLEETIENTSESKEINNIIKKSDDIEHNTESYHVSEMPNNVIKLNSEAELSEIEKNKITAEQNIKSENHADEMSDNTIECNLQSETKEEAIVEKVAEKNLELEEQNNITENSKSIMEQNIEIESVTKLNSNNKGKRLEKVLGENIKSKERGCSSENSNHKLKSESHSEEVLQEIVEEESQSAKINIVVQPKEIIEPNTKLEEHLEEKLDNTIKYNLESEINEEERSEEVAGNLLESEESEEDKLENIIDRLEKIIEGGAEDSEDENIENTELQSKNFLKINEKSTNPENLHNFEETAHKYELLNQNVQKDILETDFITKSVNQTNGNILEDVVIEVNINSPNSSHDQTEFNKKATFKNLKRNLNNIRLRIIRKCKNTLNRKLKKKGDNNPKVIQTEDIRSKLKEQLELLRTKRKTGESPLVSFSPKSSSTLKFPQRNVNRLNNITSTLIRKLSTDNTKALLESVDDSDEFQLEVQDTDVVNSDCENHNKTIVHKQSRRSQEPEESVVLSNETDLMIVNVVGGYKSPTPEARFDYNIIDVEGNSETDKSEVLNDENNDYAAKSDHDKEFVPNGITPTKTTDVTKIKGWKNKKFSIATNEEKKKPSEKLLFQLMHDNSDASNQPKNSNLDCETITEQSAPILLSSEKPKTSNQTKSAFISDELDQYLTENSELKISYEVPKLEAEQTITTKYIDIKFPELPKQNTQPSHTKNKDSYKPKTLAEKRKMLAEAGKAEVGDFLVGLNSKQRKTYEESVLRMRKKLIEDEIPFTRRCFMTSTTITNTHSFVVYNGKRLKVANKNDTEVIAQIREKRKVYKSLPTLPARPKVQRQRKPSLLNDLKADIKKFSYDSTEWETLQMKLPNLILEIKPEIGKRLHPRIEHLIKSEDFILNENRVEFALSSLKVKNFTTKQQTFAFPLSYSNDQKYITVRRRFPVVIDISTDVKKPIESDHEISRAVTDVVNKMMDYIEISEEIKDIIQDEENPEDDVQADLPKLTDNIPNKNWRRRKRKVVYGEKGVHRTTLEMKRLNCKIVSISLDEENSENVLCTKEFCKLGCICKSIECSSTNLLLSHCGLPRCMFKCKCKYKNMGVGEKFSLPAGTDIFSEGIINRLQDEAKKNLAKVEKEFTQTVIKTNNQIIVVGDSKERRRRATKMPKKYIDFVEEDPSDTPISKHAAAESKYRSLTERSPIERLPTEEPVAEPINNDTIIKIDEFKDVKNCFVKLFKYDFSGIIPFCLVHSLYKCHCKNKAVFDNSVSDKNIVACTYVNPPKSVPQLEPPVKNRLKPRIGKTFNKELYSSRTRGLVTSYYFIRNKSLSHKCKITKSSKKLQKDLEFYLRQNATKIMQDTEEATVENCKSPELLETPTEPKRQRKQSLIVLEDPGDNTSRIISPEYVTMDLQQRNGNEAERELKLQRRKTKSSIKVTGQEVVNIPKSIGESPATVIFGDTNKLKSEFLALLGKKTSQLRLLPWTTLATRFQNGSFQVWYSNTSKICPLVITENGKRPTSHHYNIKLFEHMPSEAAMPSYIIRWLINKKVPLEKPVENILLVLSPNKTYWEICGLCEKNKTDSKTKDNISISLIHNWNDPENNSNTNTTTETEPPSVDLDDVDTNMILTENDQNIPGDMEAIVHENLQENKKVMYCSKRRFQPKKLICDEIDDDSLKIRQVLWAPIPSVTLACKWRVIYMNLTFAYLSLSRSSYTIKYEDIKRAMKIAHNDKITIVLKSEELQQNYPHRNFGIYCVHNYADKVFIGPYYLNENHDLDTLSYVNGVLVNTGLLNQIKGTGVSGSGRWFHQATNSDEKNVDDDVVIIQEPTPVVDLTCESDEESVSKETSLNLEDSSSKNHSTLLKSMLLTPLSNVPPDFEEEVARAEKALDSLLKKGQLNVNKTLVHLDSLKSSNKINSLLQPASGISSAPPKITANVIENKNIEDISESNDEYKLVIDEETTEDLNVNQPPEDEAADGNNTNPCKESVIGTDLQVNRYLVTNVPGLGYISAYQHENTKIVDVVCPITKKMKQFSTPEAAISALERVFTNKFIRAPTSFKLEFQLLENLEDTTDVPLNRSVLHGYHIVGAFGVRNLLRCTATELENFGLNKLQITHMWNLFEKKLLWVPLCQLGKLLATPVKENAMESTLCDILSRTTKEIRTLQQDSALFIKEKINLESKKVMLAEKCSKLQYQLPPEQRNKAQQQLDRIVNFSNRQVLLNNGATTSDSPENSKTKTLEVSEPIILDDDDDDVLSNSNDSLLTKSTSKPIPITGPMKFTLTKGQGPVYSGTSLLSGKKVEIPSQIGKRSLLTKQLKVLPSQKDSKYVVVQRKRNASGGFVSTASTVDLSKCTFQIKPSEEKMLVKEVPIKVRKDMLKAANDSVLQLQQQQKSIMVRNGTLGNVIRTFSSSSAKNVFNNVPTISKVSKINNAVIPTTSASKYLMSHVAQPTTVNVVSSTGLPVACVPVTVVPTTSKSVGSMIKANTMATLTPMSKPPDFVLKNSTAKSTPNYIAIKEGDSLKYFQLVSETKTAVLQPVQSIKRPASSVGIQPPLKKIAPAPPSLLTNKKTY